MSVTKLSWLDGSDIHLLPGLVSPRLDQLLTLHIGDGEVRADDRDSGIAVTFRARFAGEPSNHGVSVSPDWGEVAVGPQLPSPRLRSFVIDVTVTEPSSGGSAATELLSSIRIHVHEAIERMWLTPAQLTLRAGAEGMRFSVLARFDDGVLGDITNWTRLYPSLSGDLTYVHTNGLDTPELEWSSGPGPVTVDRLTGLLTLPRATDELTRITAERPDPDAVNARASAEVRCAPAWTAPVRVEHVQGPGPDAIGEDGVRNILFLPDGFASTDGDKDAFERSVRTMIGRLSTRTRTRPWDLLKGSFNYFRAWVPSPQAGITILQELDRAVEGGTTVGRELEPALRPGPAVTSWSLHSLLFEVGPPAPAFDQPGSPLGTEASGRLAAWRALYGTDVTEDLAERSYPEWLARGDRVLLNERDTAFHTVMGARPALTPKHGSTELGFHPRRMHEDDFNAFVGALVGDGDEPLPHNPWAQGEKDETLIVILCRSNRLAGTNFPRGDTAKVMCVTVGGEGSHRLRANPDDDGFDVRPDTVPPRIPLDPWAAVAHELAHSFDLADEYGNEGRRGSSTLPADRADELATRPNVQPRGELVDSFGQLITVSPTRPKWGSWPRIAKAGVLAVEAQDLGGGGTGPFRLELRPGHGAPFQQDDVVRLRRRPLVTAGSPSARLKVTGVELDHLTAVRVESELLDPSAFPAGPTAPPGALSIVIAAVRAPDPVPGMDVYGDDLALVAASVRERIDRTHNPLNASHTDVIGRPCEPLPLEGEPYKRPTQATSFPGGIAPRPPRWSPWILGLYEGGHDHDCGVHRPAGICMMRRGVATTDFEPAAPQAPEDVHVYQFCTVCRYAIVDLIDPSQHGALDADYAPEVPGMTIVKAFWLDGSDIHLLPGLVSPRLDQIMFLFDGNRLFRADERDPSVNVLFVPRFAGSPDNHGVRVDVQTGEVTVASPLPGPPRLRSFVIEATVSDPGPPGSGQPPSSFQLSVRVNVHEDIERMWLTPSPLTVRENAKGVRFTVLAEFDDGAIGDITNWAPSATPLTGDRSFVHVDGSGAPELTPELTWSEGPGPVTVDAVTGHLTLAAAADQATRITARRPFPEPVPPSASASADARCAGPWSDPVRLAHVQGPGFAAMADEGVRNVLFLPDGFTGSEDDKAAFERCVRVIVSRLSVRARTRPWDLLTERFNYFRAWVPSPQAGVSVLNELDRAVEGGATVGYALEHALKPAEAKPSWLINELLFEVGPPAPDHDTPGSPLGTVTSGRLQDWRTLYGTRVTEARVNPTYPAWLDRSDRVLLNERDTAFHTAMGERPRLDQQAPPRALQFHPLRMHFDDFDDFLRALTDDQGNELPEKVWGRTGKDENLVTIVCRTNRHAAANSRRGTTGKYLCVGLNDATTHQLTTNPDDNGFDVRPDPVPATVSVTTWTAVAHELAHSFDLGDEYGNQSGGGPTILPAAEAPKLAAKPNVQPRGELEDADGKLIATSLTNPKWGAWPRIAKAGVLADDPEDLSGGRGEGPFVLRLQPGHGGAFEFHDVIRLRRRPLATAGAASDRLKVTSVDLDQLTAERLEVAALDPAGFPAGQTAAARGVPASIVLVPLRTEDPLPGMDVYGDDLGLVAQSVRARIDETHNPLNASDLEAADRPCQPLLGEAFKYPTDAINFPGGTAPKPPRWSPWIVGLYEGGNEYDCGVYRPTGMCMMRRQLTTTDEQTFVYSFCPVCRYAMVDLLDPTRHGDIDRDYESRYPA